jgi:hypothetical protein
MQAWMAAGANGYIRVLDSALYGPGAAEESPYALDLGGRGLTIEAEDGEQPTFIGDMAISPGGGRFELVGFFHQGTIELQSGGTAVLHHVTGSTSIVVTATDAPLVLTASKSIVGPVMFNPHFGRLELYDCIIGDGQGPAVRGSRGQGNAPAAIFERSTVLGAVHVEELHDAQDTLFMGRVRVRRRHAGLMRSCAFPAGSNTCRRIHCFEFRLEQVEEPDESPRDKLPPPSFVSSRYGDPGFGLLTRDAHASYRTGASNGHELGVYNAARQHDRLRFLRASVHEYLPVGRWVDIQFVN